jgi:hypothetical protein
MPKSWSEKFHNGKAPIVAPSIRTVSGFPPGSQMLVPVPSQIDEYMRSIPSGEDRTPAQMATDLARAAGADLTCPMCCGLFLRICSEKAFEELEAGSLVENITPFCPKEALVRLGVRGHDARKGINHSSVTRVNGNAFGPLEPQRGDCRITSCELSRPASTPKPGRGASVALRSPCDRGRRGSGCLCGESRRGVQAA